MQKLMICGVLLFICIQASSGEFRDENFGKGDYECLKELNIEKQYVKDAFEENLKLQEGNPKINEYVACSWKKAGQLTAEGNLNLNVINSWVRSNLFRFLEKTEVENKDEVAVKVLDTCKVIQGDDTGDTAVKVYNCIIDYILQL